LGVRGVVAPSDSGNGYTNCFQNGVLPMRLPIEQVEVLVAQRAGGASSTVDLAQATSVAPDSTQTTFAIDPLRREALLNAIDGSGLTLKDDALIRAWQADGRRRRPWAWPA
jgi:3-isopropylmalate/(R)-2-methylmalate dehydratase small subunit